MPTASARRSPPPCVNATVLCPSTSERRRYTHPGTPARPRSAANAQQPRRRSPPPDGCGRRPAARASRRGRHSPSGNARVRTLTPMPAQTHSAGRLRFKAAAGLREYADAAELFAVQIDVVDPFDPARTRRSAPPTACATATAAAAVSSVACESDTRGAGARASCTAPRRRGNKSRARAVRARRSAPRQSSSSGQGCARRQQAFAPPDWSNPARHTRARDRSGAGLAQRRAHAGRGEAVVLRAEPVAAVGRGARSRTPPPAGRSRPSTPRCG